MRAVKHAFAHAAQNEATDLAQAAAPHHNLVGLMLPHLPDDLQGGFAVRGGPRDPDAGFVKYLL